MKIMTVANSNQGHVALYYHLRRTVRIGARPSTPEIFVDLELVPLYPSGREGQTWILDRFQ